MYPDYVLGSLVRVPENLVTMIALEPAHLVELLMVIEILLVLETFSAVPLPAEIWKSEVHLAMNFDGCVVSYRVDGKNHFLLILMIHSWSNISWDTGTSSCTTID